MTDKFDIAGYIKELKQDYGYMLEHTAGGGYVCRGWTNLIKDMLKELKDLHSEDTKEYPVLTNIKNKHGSLCVYGRNISNADHTVINRHIVRASKTCMTCGNSGKFYAKDGWLYIACNEHSNGGEAEDDES